MASYLVGLFTDQAVWVQALVQDIVLCSWARQFIVTVPLSTKVYNCNLGQYNYPPSQSNDEGAKEQKTCHFGIIEMGGGVAQMFHLFCPRLWVTANLMLVGGG